MKPNLTKTQTEALAQFEANGKLLGELHGSIGVRYTWQNGSAAPVPHHQTIRALRNKRLVFQLPFSSYPEIGWICLSSNPDDQLSKPLR